MKARTPSVEVRFGMSSGLAETLLVPIHTTAHWTETVEQTEQALKLRVDRGGEAAWDLAAVARAMPNDDDDLCRAVMQHNRWVDHVWERLMDWHEAPDAGQTEEMTPESAMRFWRGLTKLEVPIARWSRAYYVDRMDSMYEAMRGRSTEGVHPGVSFTKRQAAAVIWMLAPLLDKWDCDLEVPRGEDALYEHDVEDGYVWCKTHGPMMRDALPACRSRSCETCTESRGEPSRMRG